MSSIELIRQGQQLAVNVADCHLEFLYQGLDLVVWQLLQLAKGLGDGYACCPQNTGLSLHYPIHTSWGLPSFSVSALLGTYVRPFYLHTLLLLFIFKKPNFILLDLFSRDFLLSYL